MVTKRIVEWNPGGLSRVSEPRSASGGTPRPRPCFWKTEQGLSSAGSSLGIFNSSDLLTDPGVTFLVSTVRNLQYVRTAGPGAPGNPDKSRFPVHRHTFYATVNMQTMQT